MARSCAAATPTTVPIAMSRLVLMWLCSLSQQPWKHQKPDFQPMVVFIALLWLRTCGWGFQRNALLWLKNGIVNCQLQLQFICSCTKEILFCYFNSLFVCFLKKHSGCQHSINLIIINNDNTKPYIGKSLTLLDFSHRWDPVI